MGEAEGGTDHGHAVADVGWPELFSVFGRIGLLSFGGPAGQIALMHKELVEDRRWLDEPRFLHALNFCMLLPGPEAMQLATYSGWLLKGVRGGLVAGLLFVLPGFLVMVALSAAFFFLGHMPAIGGLLLGLKAAVLAIVVQAMVRIAGKALGSRFGWVVALSAFAAIAFLKVPFPLIVLAAGFAGILHSFGRARAGLLAPARVAEGGKPAATLRTILVWSAIWIAPLAALILLFPGVFAEMGLFFSQAAIVSFGGAYAVLAYVAQEAVSVHGWLEPGDMLAGLGLAETTPGPLILVLVFVGFLGGARLGGIEPLAGGVAGATVALFFTFLPSFFFIFLGAPYIERLRGVRWLAEGLAAITAAVVGVIANLALWFGLHVLFGKVGEVAFGPLALPAPHVASVDVAALVIALAAGIALLKFRAGLFTVLGGAVAAGLVAVLSGLA